SMKRTRIRGGGWREEMALSFQLAAIAYRTHLATVTTCCRLLQQTQHSSTLFNTRQHSSTLVNMNASLLICSLVVIAISLSTADSHSIKNRVHRSSGQSSIQ